MKIGIDATPLTIPFPCGTKQYSEQLLENLAKIDNKNQYIIFASKKVSIPNQANFKFVKIPSFIPVLKRQLFLASFAYQEKVDVFHYLEPYGAIFFSHPKIVTTVHDLDLGLTYSLIGKHVLNRLQCEITRVGVFKNTKIFITDSSTIKKELQLYLKKLNIKAEIKVVYLGVGKGFKVKSNIKDKEKYFFCMGDFAPRKNIPRIMEAYSNLPKGIKNKYNLKIVASTRQAGQKFRKLAKKLGIDAFVKIYTSTSNSKLVKLYNSSFAFLYPSLYEGFGIPILEAMACGCPVITSNYGAMKEIASNSALLVNPLFVKDISSAMKKLVTSPNLRKNLISKGLQRVKQFSWLHTARKTLESYYETYRRNSL